MTPSALSAAVKAVAISRPLSGTANNNQPKRKHMLTFYDYQDAPSPRRARIFLAEKGVQAKVVEVDLKKGEQMSEAFRAINPRCAVPALATEDGQVISENLAIAAYIEERFPDTPLMGTTPFERAMVLEWNWRCEFEGLAAVAEILRNTSPHMKGRAMTGPRNIEQLPKLAERGRIRLNYFWEDLNTQLETHEYVAGETYSFADITALVGVDFSAWVKATPDKSLSAIWEWHAKASARPASKL